jgi:hypothetical protein
VLVRPATCDDPARAVPHITAEKPVTLFQGNELVIEFRVFQFGSSKARRLGIVIAGVAIIFLILVLMFGRG